MDNYEELIKIGEGTYGVVYRAKDKRNKNTVAIKKIKIDSINEGVPSTAIREISVLKEFRHPNIIRYSERLMEVVYEERKKLWLVFEHMQEDLKIFLSKNKLTNIEATEFLGQILSGIAYCHGHRILHRDIKPQNILVDFNRTIKLADFGLARCFGIPLRQYTHEVVTLWYRAPEILLKNDYYSTSVDIWSVGCIYVEMGKPLFPGETEIDQLFRIFRVLGTPDKDLWSGVENMPYYNTKWPKWPPIDLKTLIPGISTLSLQLLKNMLTFDPMKRITARNAYNTLKNVSSD
ncbi:hypothetical protein MXB_3848 [Myxobolus squamalis]|nr:hypothetical protein MXB_3848 [Myxobolus squamalis]